MRVLKFEIPIDGQRHEIWMPKGEILHGDIQFGNFCIWVKGLTEKERPSFVDPAGRRVFKAVVTGQEFEDGVLWKHVKSAQRVTGDKGFPFFVAHLFEL